MINKSKKINILGLMLLALGFVLSNANVQEVSAQEGDPFRQPNWKTPKVANPNPSPVAGGAGKTADAKALPKVKLGPAPVGIPAIQDRVNYYKRLRESAIQNNQPYPQPTSVMTLDELSVTGIFRTPKGMAAMVEATPIGLSYTIYPGEKFFNGQLVAIEENKLVFRKVIKMSDGKFIASEDNKTLRQYTQAEEMQGTVPTEAGKTEIAKTSEPTQSTPAPVQQSSTPPSTDLKTAPVTAILSPLDEMNKAVETPKIADGKTIKGKNGKATTTTTKKGAKKPVKVAENREN